MLIMIAAAAVAALSTPPQASADCRTVSVYFRSGRADLEPAAAGLVDTVYALVGSTDGSRLAAAITGHIDSDEQAQGLTSLDEERVAAVWSRLEALRAGQGAPWSFTVSSMDDTMPARPSSDQESLNRRVELAVCPTAS